MVNCSLKYLLAFTMLLSAPAIGADNEFVLPYGAAPDADLKNLEWNRYTTDNFTILSIDNSQGKWLSDNIDTIKSWCLARWGFPDSKFTKECRVFCVPNRTLLKKLFGLDQPKIEIRKDLTAIWMVLDDKPAKVIPNLVTPIALSEFESKNNAKIGWWFKRGASILSSPVAEIRQSLAAPSVLSSEKLFTMTEEDYNKESAENKKAFDQGSAYLCLMLRKEFGEAKMQGFLRMSSRNSPQGVLKVIYGFSGYSHFDKQFGRFVKDLSGDLLNNTPDSYLEIKQVR